MSESVALSARVSSAQQQSAGTIASQVAALEARIAAEGGTLGADQRYLDDGYSGGTLVRPALERLRDAAAAGQRDRLYVHSPDRLARKYAYQVVLLEELQRAGVAVVFLTGPTSPSAEDELLRQVQGMVAEYERARRAERSRRGRRYRARCGQVSALSAAPYGYRYRPKAAGGGEARYEVVLEEARLVRQLFTWVGQDRLSLGAVVRRLAAAGERPRTGKPHWDRGTLRKLLRNPAYTGAAAFGKTHAAVPPTPRPRPARGQPTYPRRPTWAQAAPAADWIPIPVPAIVSPALFAAVGEQRDENRRRARGREGAGHLLAGLLCCGRCGYAYVAASSTSHGRRHACYRCTGTEPHRFGGTRVWDKRPVHLDQLEAVVWQEVQAVRADPRRLQDEYARRAEAAGASPEAELVASLTARIQAAQRGRERLIDGYAEGLLSAADLAPRLGQLDARRAALEEQRRTAHAAAEHGRDLRLVLATLEAFAATVRGQLDQADAVTQRSLVRALVKRIEVQREEVRIIFRIAPPSHGPDPPAVRAPHCGRSGAAVPTPASPLPLCRSQARAMQALEHADPTGASVQSLTSRDTLPQTAARLLLSSA
jgi:site-specific DNA recombinase